MVNGVEGRAEIRALRVCPVLSSARWGVKRRDRAQREKKKQVCASSLSILHKNLQTQTHTHTCTLVWRKTTIRRHEMLPRALQREDIARSHACAEGTLDMTLQLPLAKSKPLIRFLLLLIPVHHLLRHLRHRCHHVRTVRCDVVGNIYGLPWRRCSSSVYNLLLLLLCRRL